MRWSQSFAPTLKETPAEAEIASHQLLLRAGLIRKLAGGLYTFLPMGLKTLQKISQIIREEMNRSGALEILMPALQPPRFGRRADATRRPAMSCSKPKIGPNGNGFWALPMRRWSPPLQPVKSIHTDSYLKTFIKFRPSFATRFAPGSGSCVLVSSS